MNKVERVRAEAARTYEAGFSIMPAGRALDEKAAGKGWKTWEPPKNTDGTINLSEIVVNYGIRGGELQDGRKLIVIDFDHVDDTTRNQEFLEGHCASITPHGRHMFCTITEEQVKDCGIKAGNANILGIGPAPDYVSKGPKDYPPPKEGEPGTLDTTNFPELAGLVIDYKYQGGYVIAPGSYANDKPYYWYHNPAKFPLQPIPGCFLKAIKAFNDSKKGKTGKVTSNLAKSGDIVTNAVNDIHKAKHGSRNDTICAVSYFVGRRVDGLSLDVESVKARLIQAAIDNGLLESEAVATVNSGLESGLKKPLATKAPTQAQALMEVLAIVDTLYYSERGWVQYSDQTGCYSTITDQTAVCIITAAIEEVYGERHPFAANVISGIITLFKGKPARFIHKDQFDRDPNILTLRNCCYNIKSKSFTDHAPSNYTTMGFSFDFDPDAKCEAWDKIMASVTAIDPDTVKFLQEYFGYCLTLDTSYEVFCWLIGSPGGGKSTIIEGLKSMLNGLCGNFSLDNLKSQFGLSCLVGKTCVTASEQPTGFVQTADKLNSIVSGETITVDVKYKQPFDYVPKAKLFWASNELPRLSSGFNGIYRRAKFVDLPAIPRENMDITLKDKLKDEAPGILNWALIGLDRLTANKGFTETKAMVDLTNSFRKSNNPVEQFKDEMTKPLHEIEAKALYQNYVNWTEEAGVKAQSNPMFNKAMRSLGCETRKSSGSVIWKNLSLDTAGLTN